jgi:predicted RNA-binding protein Jag
MYDPSNDPHEFVGSGRAEAVSKACQFFRTTEDALEIFELDPSDVYGLGARTVVVAAPRDRKPREARGGGRGDEGRGERGGREFGGERGERGDRGGRGERGERGGRGGRGGRGDRGGRGERGEPREARAAEAPRFEAPAARAPVSAEPSVGTAVGELGEIGRFVLGAVERMGLGSFEVSETSEEGLVVVSLRGDAARALGGGDGRPVDALQLIANQAAMRRSEDPDRIVLEVEGDVEARESRLADLAERAARRARETGRAIALDPMSGRDRRIIHLELRGAEGVATMSIGEGRYRQVVVVPEGAPEYEDAVRESRAAAAAASEADA